MANMFSGNVEKKIPKSFKECYATDNVTHNLWIWCERLEKWGFRIFIALMIIGIATIIKESIEAAQLLDELNIDMNEIRTAAAEYGIEIKSVFEVVIENIFLWSLYSFLEYCAYHVLALLVGSLANIVQHTKITANIALYSASLNPNIKGKESDEKEEHCESTKKEKSTPKSDVHKWKCTNCGNVISQDPCPNCDFSIKDNIVVTKETKEDTWICPECCRENLKNTDKCKCGYKK